MAPPGRLIALEGGEGAGKSTQAALLAQRLGAELTREPGGTPLGEEIRRLVLEPAAGPLAARCELMLLLAARAEHLASVIEPALRAGRHVVVDRFSGSTVAYQGYGRGLPLQEVEEACRIAADGRRPDLNVLVDVPVRLGTARRERGGRSRDRIEGEDGGFHERVREGFLAQAGADPARWCIVDGRGDVATVASEVISAVTARLGLVPPQGVGE